MRLHVHRFGVPDGAPVLCLHGVMGTGERFRRLAASALPHRAVLAPDLRGHGGSGRQPPWNIEAHLDDLRDTLDAEGVGGVDVIGFSFGGRLALELAAADPERVRRLALLDPAVRMDPATAGAFAADACREPAFTDEAEAVDARLAALHHAPRAHVEQDLAGALVRGDDGRLRYAMTPAAIVAAYGELARAPRLPTDRPTLLVRAAAGLVDDVQEALLHAALGAALSVERVPGAHPVMWDAFDETVDAIARHLVD